MSIGRLFIQQLSIISMLTIMNTSYAKICILTLEYVLQCEMLTTTRNYKNLGNIYLWCDCNK